MKTDDDVRCVTVSYGLVRGTAKQWRYHQPAVYRVVETKAGNLQWRYIRHAGTARRSYKLAERDAMKLAWKMGIPFVHGIRNHADFMETAWGDAVR